MLSVKFIMTQMIGSSVTSLAVDSVIDINDFSSFYNNSDKGTKLGDWILIKLIGTAMVN